MTKASRALTKKIEKAKRQMALLHKPSQFENIFRIDELWSSAFGESNVMDLLSYRGMTKSTFAEADAEMVRRVKAFMRLLVPTDEVETLLVILKKHNAGFGGYEVLKLYVPACLEHNAPPKRIFTLFTPQGEFHAMRDFFISTGYRITFTNGETMEQQRRHYGKTVSNTINLRSRDNTVFVDIVESVNDVPFFPVFRMPTTLHMHCLFADRLIAPYGKLSCQQKGIINPVHYTGKHLLTLPPSIHDIVDDLEKKCNVTLHRNPCKLYPHEGKCGLDPNCLHTLRSTTSPGSVIYSFTRTEIRNDKLLDFLESDGVLWRLGGWSCYPDGVRGLQPLLLVVESLHAMFDGQELADDMSENEALKCLVGWE